MKFIIVRHGETQDNKMDISMGWNDSELTPLGIKQANKIKEMLIGVPLDYVYSSDLNRAVETAKIIIGKRGISLIKSETLREQSRGIYEGKPRKELYAAVKGDYYNWTPENGESLERVWERVIPLIEELKSKKGITLIVAHRKVNSCIIAYLMGDEVSSYNKYNHKGHNNITEIETT